MYIKKINLISGHYVWKGESPKLEEEEESWSISHPSLGFLFFSLLLLTNLSIADSSAASATEDSNRQFFNCFRFPLNIILFERFNRQLRQNGELFMEEVRRLSLHQMGKNASLGYDRSL